MYCVCVCLLDGDRADRQTDIIESERASRMLEDSSSFSFHTRCRSISFSVYLLSSTLFLLLLLSRSREVRNIKMDWSSLILLSIQVYIQVSREAKRSKANNTDVTTLPQGVRTYLLTLNRYIY